MIENINQTEVYKNLKLDSKASNTYLFYSSDSCLNDNIALFFARIFVCENKTSCGICPACRQFNQNSHPDVTIINQSAVKVEDINNLIPKFSTRPLSAENKIFVLLNADNINEISQNKLLKSLEEPNEQNIFILTTAKIDKLLPTVLSRLNKLPVPRLSPADKEIIKDNLNSLGIKDEYINSEFNLTEMIEMSTNNEVLATVNDISYIFKNLNQSADIPVILSKIKPNKDNFLKILQDLFICALNGDQGKYNKDLINLISSKFNQKCLSRCLPLIEDAHLKVCSNVNFSYVLDMLLFNILKEKFLCS